MTVIAAPSDVLIEPDVVESAAALPDDDFSGGGEPGDVPVGRAVRTAVAVALTTVAAGVLVGGTFRGPSARIVGVLAGLAGIALAMLVSRLGGAGPRPPACA